MHSVPRWIRQQRSVPGAKLTLYKYGHPAHLEGLPKVGATNADSDGRFDFGPLSDGHYILRIQGMETETWFDVEIIQSVPKTDHVLIDISPATPDCKGGHEFIPTARK
jgi:hypothetical protein